MNSGLYLNKQQSTPSKTTNIQNINKKMLGDSKEPNQTINLLHSYLRVPFSSKSLFSFKRLKSTSNANESNKTMKLSSSTLQAYNYPSLSLSSYLSKSPLCPPKISLKNHPTSGSLFSIFFPLKLLSRKSLKPPQPPARNLICHSPNRYLLPPFFLPYFCLSQQATTRSPVHRSASMSSSTTSMVVHAPCRVHAVGAQHKEVVPYSSKVLPAPLGGEKASFSCHIKIPQKHNNLWFFFLFLKKGGLQYH